MNTCILRFTRALRSLINMLYPAKDSSFQEESLAGAYLRMPNNCTSLIHHDFPLTSVYLRHTQ